jgi:hypothetical protein
MHRNAERAMISHPARKRTAFFATTRSTIPDVRSP